MTPADMNTDAIIACAELAGRSGATSSEFGHTGSNRSKVDDPIWYAQARFRERTIRADGLRSPTLAATALAERLLSGATCRCGRLVALADGHPDRCRWRLDGASWKSGCDAPSIRMPPGTRGDVDAIERAMDERRAGRL